MIIRTATLADVPAIVALLADDRLGAGREQPGDPAYAAAFSAMAAQSGNLQLVGEQDGAIVACAQLTLIAGLSRRGTLRAVIEGVRVAGALRGQGLGRALILHCIAAARARGATLMQLTSDVSRTDAHRFYEGLGFATTSVGMKLSLA